MGQSPEGIYLNTNSGTIFYQGKTDFGTRYPTERIYTEHITRTANAGDVLLSVRAPVGDINISTTFCCIGRGLASISSLNYKELIYYILKANSNIFNSYNGEGTVFGSIDKKSLHKLKIKIPDNSKYLEKISETINRKCLIIHEINEQLNKLKQLYLKKFFG